MTSLHRGLLASLVGAVLLLAVGCDAQQSESAAEPQPELLQVQMRQALRVGDPAPEFRLWDMDGNDVALSGQRGKVILLNFWATWCGPCRVEMPSMELLYREFSRQDFEILAVSTDPQGVAVTRPFRDSIGLSFPILHDSDFRVGVTYGARTLPMTFLIDRQGIITHRIFGARNWGGPEAKEMIRDLVRAS